MPAIRKNNRGLRLLLALWSKHVPLTAWHEAWASANVRIRRGFRRQDVLYEEGQRQKNIYLAIEGLLARVSFDPSNGRRQILSVALPGMALMTTDHLYSSTPSKSDICILRSNTIVVQIPYAAIKNFYEQEPNLSTLINVIGNKKKKQLAALRRISLDPHPVSACTQFLRDMPELHQVLTQQEIADLLGISRSSVQEAEYLHATGKRRQKRKI